MTLRDNAIYNQSDKSNGNMIYVICNSEEQQDKVVERMTTDNCTLESYEVWEDTKVILTFRVLDEYEIKSDLN